MKKLTAIITSFLVLAFCLTPYSLAVDEQTYIGQEIIEPRYEVISGISTTLAISESGRADSRATVHVPSGYEVDLLAELQQKNGSRWETIHDWEGSGSGRVSVSGPWYVMPGYSYRLKVTVTVYDSNGNFVEAPVECSKVEEY